MDGKYFTVEQISEILKIHPKTIQRYIREGRLKASKIGKSWRVTGHDLSEFTEGTKAESHNTDSTSRSEERVKVSSVIDIDVDNRDNAIRIMNTLNAVLNSKPHEYSRSTMQVQYLETEYKVRVMLWGNIPFIEVMISSISMLTNLFEEE